MTPRLRPSVPARPAVAAGMTLIIAMVMLAVIGLASVAVLRDSLSTDQVALGVRSQSQALQYAQAALRWCERRAASGAAAPGVLPPATPAHWVVPGHWRGPSAEAYSLTRADLSAAGGGAFPASPPQCLVEQRALADGLALVVTARGASLDYVEDRAGRSLNGSMVWVQSVRLPGSASRAWRQLVTPPAP